MCLLILANKKDSKLPDETTQAAVYSNNDDGFGILVLDRGRFELRKTMQGVEQIARLIEWAKGMPCMMHWRFRTNGPRTLDLVHPFRVTKKNKSGRDSYMAHNGVIHIQHQKDESDTLAFTRHILRPIASRAPDLLHDPALGALIADYIGHGSKIVLWSDDNRASIIHEKAGTWKDGSWYSNTYSLTSAYRASKWTSWSDAEGDMCGMWSQGYQSAKGAAMAKIAAQANGSVPSISTSATQSPPPPPPPPIAQADKQEVVVIGAPSSEPIPVPVQSKGYQPSELRALSYQEIKTLVENEPEAMAVFLSDYKIMTDEAAWHATLNEPVNAAWAICTALRTGNAV